MLGVNLPSPQSRRSSESEVTTGSQELHRLQLLRYLHFLALLRRDHETPYMSVQQLIR